MVVLSSIIAHPSHCRMRVSVVDIWLAVGHTDQSGDCNLGLKLMPNMKNAATSNSQNRGMKRDISGSLTTRDRHVGHFPKCPRGHSQDIQAREELGRQVNCPDYRINTMFIIITTVTENIGITLEERIATITPPVVGNRLAMMKRTTVVTTSNQRTTEIDVSTVMRSITTALFAGKETGYLQKM